MVFPKGGVLTHLGSAGCSRDSNVYDSGVFCPRVNSCRVARSQSVSSSRSTVSTEHARRQQERNPASKGLGATPLEVDGSSSTSVLPNKLLIHSVSQADVAFLYNEIWEQRSYLAHGICIVPGDTVIDVGANIGLFALQAAMECPGGRVLAFEPIPTIFDALQRNVALNVTDHSSACVELINAGLSDGSLQQAEFTFYEQAAGWSTMCEDENELRSAMDLFLASALSTGEGLGESRMASLGTWLQARVHPAVFKRLSRLYVSWMLSRATKATCPLYTLSEILKERNVQRVDLLKIDVERAELDVLNGIQQSDWPKIKQVVMEVHDIDDRLERVEAILRRAGLQDIVLEQSQALQDSTLFNLYAKRTAGSQCDRVAR